MNVSGRAFLNYCIGSSTPLGLGAITVDKLSRILAGPQEMPAVIWLEGAGCGGCTLSLAGQIWDARQGGPADVEELLAGCVNPVHGLTLPVAGDLAVSNLRTAQRGGSFVLVVEGGIPTAFDGMTCTVMTENDTRISIKAAVEELAPAAREVVCVGACACSGGIAAADPDPTRVRTVTQLTGIDTLNLPGCPPHPDRIAGTLAAVLCGDVPPT